MVDMNPLLVELLRDIALLVVTLWSLWNKLFRDLFILVVTLWALWSEFSPNTKTSIPFSLARLGIGFGAIILLSKFSDNLSMAILGLLVLVFSAAIIREKQKR